MTFSWKCATWFIITSFIFEFLLYAGLLRTQIGKYIFQRKNDNIWIKYESETLKQSIRIRDEWPEMSVRPLSKNFNLNTCFDYYAIVEYKAANRFICRYSAFIIIGVTSHRRLSASSWMPSLIIFFWLKQNKQLNCKIYCKRVGRVIT